MNTRLSKGEKGFTLLELMIAISITLILTTLTVYNLLGELPKYRLRSTANRVAATIQYLKIRAVATSKVAWLDVNYATAENHFYTGYVDSGDGGSPTAAEYAATNLDFTDNISSKPCFKLPPTVSFGFPDGFSSGSGPDGTTHPGAGNFITTYSAGGYSGGGYFGYRPTGVPVVNPSSLNAPSTAHVIYLKNDIGQGYAVSVQITGRVKVWRWIDGGWI